jgi:MFS family permease
VCPLIGLCTLTMLNSANATMQLESEPALRGRVMALYMTIVMGGTPIGSPVIGWIGEQYGARWTLLAGGTLTILGVLVAVGLFARPARPHVGSRDGSPDGSPGGSPAGSPAGAERDPARTRAA